MTKNQIEECLARAAEAQKLADSLADGPAKQSWQKIAQGYRDLAQKALTEAVRDATADLPSQIAAAQASQETSDA